MGNFKPVYTLGKGPSHRVQFIAGITTVKRDGMNYLYGTLWSIFYNMHPIHDYKLAVVVLIAENDLEYVKQEARYVEAIYYKNHQLLTF